MQPVKLLVVKDPELRTGIKAIVDDSKNSDFFALEATRGDWQRSPGPSRLTDAGTVRWPR
jgi:hypothetical protein